MHAHKVFFLWENVYEHQGEPWCHTSHDLGHIQSLNEGKFLSCELLEVTTTMTILTIEIQSMIDDYI